MTDLCLIMEKYGSDKVPTIKHNYTKVYHSLFSSIREDKLRVFELGIGTTNPNRCSNMSCYKGYQPGASLRGWKEYFPNSQIFGADIDTDILFEEDRIGTFFCDQTKPEVIRALWKQLELQEPMDIIIDDGLHSFIPNMTFFENSIHKTKKFYVIEDIHDSDIHNFKNKIAQWYWQGLHRDCTFWVHTLPAKTSDDNMIVVEKNRNMVSRPFYKKLKENWDVFTKISKFMEETLYQRKGEGSYMSNGVNMDYEERFYDKQEILWEVASNSHTALEIGTDCHSLFILLLANPKMNVTVVDPCSFAHKEKCITYLKETFPEATITLIKRKGLYVLETCKECYDLIHLNESTEYNVIKAQLEYMAIINPKFVVIHNYHDSNVANALKYFEIIPDKISALPYTNCFLDFQKGTQEITMVSAFFKLKGVRSMDLYVHCANRLFEATPHVKWIVYTDQKELQHLITLPNVKIILVPSISYFLDLPETITIPKTIRPDRESFDYMRVQNSKFKMVIEAFKESKTNSFGWIDFGMLQYTHHRDKEIGFFIYLVSRKKLDHLYIPGFPGYEDRTNLIDNIIWSFAGTSFFGTKDSIMAFSEAHQALLHEVLEKGVLPWEINIWHGVYFKNKELATRYLATDHNFSMFKNLLCI